MMPTRAASGSMVPPIVLLATPAGLPPGAIQVVGERALAESGLPVEPVAPGALGPALDALPADRAVVVVDAGWLTVPTVYGDLVADPRLGAAVLTSDDGSVVAVRLPAGRPPSLARGLPVSDAVQDLARRIRRAGPVREVTCGEFPMVRVGSDLAAATAVVDGADEAALRLRRASRSDDGFLSHFLVRPLSRQLTKRVVRTPLSPARITAVSLALGLGSAAAYTGGSRPWLLAGSLLLLCSLVVDCVDGEVARYTRTFSALGGWLDVASDRVKEYAVYAGLAVGAAAAADRQLWGLALAAMAVLVVRHAVDFGFAAATGPVGGSSGSAVARLSASTSERRAVMWAKRAVILPVGERTLILIILVPATGPDRALWLLLGWGIVAGVYTTLGRVGRMWRTDRPAREGEGVAPVAAARLAAQCDSAPLDAAVLGASRPWGWLAPAACRVVEAGAVVALLWWAAGRQLLPAAFALLGIAAFRGYDVVYRQRLAGAVGPEDGLAWCGWPVRLGAVAVLALLVRAGVPPSTAAAVLWVLAPTFGLGSLVACARWWQRLPRGWVQG